MKKVALAVLTVVLFATAAFAADGKKLEPNQQFYLAGNYYQKGDYIKAIEEYLKIMDAGVESGSLYYNIGNSFLKMGRAGYAILCYEKARRIIPRDADLKSNLDYARTLAADTSDETSSGNVVARIIKRPFREFNLNAIAILAAVIYCIVIVLSALSILSPIIARKLRGIYVVALAMFIVSIAAFGIRFYDEKVLKHGIVVVKEAEAKYEPIDKSTTYYKLREGSNVVILSTRDGWRQVRRYDGKTAWVNKNAVEEI
jgi:tetratricopeptide (TPR) repeat protein